MTRLLLLAALFSGATAIVITCNEAKRLLASDSPREFPGTQACVVLPSSEPAPYYHTPYTDYMDKTYLVDVTTAQKYKLSNFEADGTFCVNGEGPWTIESDVPASFLCSSDETKLAEIIFLFTSEPSKIVRAGTAPSSASYTKGTYTIVAPEGSLMIKKDAIKDGKETTLSFYSGIGQDEFEERFSLMPEKFVAGTGTVILGPVTTLVIEDDVEVTMTVTALDEKNFIPAQPGYDFTVMSSGMANDLQSSRQILVSTAYGINDENLLYDALSITGTVKFDEDVKTKLSLECSRKDADVVKFSYDKTNDIIQNLNCVALDITYTGSLTADQIDRSSEVIYLRISSYAQPVEGSTTTAAAPSGSTSDSSTTTASVNTATMTTKRTPRPTSASASSSAAATSTTSQSSTTTTPAATTTTSDAAAAAAGMTMLSLLLSLML